MKNVLYILETALWTFIALVLLLFVLVYLIFSVPGWLEQHPRYPADWQWYIIWGAIGIVVMLMGLLWWWWGRVLKDHEEAERFANSTKD